MNNFYDVIIVGGGPAGLSSAIYLARAKYKVLVMEQAKFGGQITITDEIVNYPGVFKTSGKELTEQMRLQGKAFGAEYILSRASKLDLSGDIKVITTEQGVEYKSLGVVLALGASPRKLGFKGEMEYAGRGVAYCATCDGEFFTGKEVLVVGGGFAAVEEAMFLTKYASKVTILVRKNTFSCAQTIVDKLSSYPKISVKYNTELLECSGNGVVTSATLINNLTKETYNYSANGNAFGIFIFAGYTPQSEIVREQIECTKEGYIITDVDQKTSLDGVYAAGDVCVKNLRQVVTAVSDGATAATSLEKHVSHMHEKLNLPAFVQEKTKEVAQPKQEIKKETNTAKNESAFISSDIRAQLTQIFARFNQKITVVAMCGNDSASSELSGFVSELNGISPNVTTSKENIDGTSYIDIRSPKGASGIRYYSIPGGHEFNSFVLSLYNVAGPGQPIGDALKNRIISLKGSHTLKVMATLSCTNCPDVVMGSQRIASLNENIQAEMYDLSKFPQIKDKYNIMAVPCLIIDDKSIHFGKQSLEQIVNIIENL